MRGSAARARDRPLPGGVRGARRRRRSPRPATPDAVLRLYLTPGREARTSPSRSRSSARSRPSSRSAARAGIALISLLGVRAEAPWLLGGVKSTSYAVNMAAEAEARARGADDAVFVARRRRRARGAGDERLVAARRRRCSRPSLDLGILAGVTRATLIELAPASGYAVVEGAFPLDELLEAEEVFTSSSVREVMPVVEVDGTRSSGARPRRRCRRRCERQAEEEL